MLCSIAGAHLGCASIVFVCLIGRGGQEQEAVHRALQEPPRRAAAAEEGGGRGRGLTDWPKTIKDTGSPHLKNRKK